MKKQPSRRTPEYRPDWVGGAIYAALFSASLAVGLLVDGRTGGYASAALFYGVLMWWLTREHYRKRIHNLNGQLSWAEALAEHWEKTAQNYRKAYRK
jgi:hypothetical protein